MAAEMDGHRAERQSGWKTLGVRMDQLRTPVRKGSSQEHKQQEGEHDYGVPKASKPTDKEAPILHRRPSRLYLPQAEVEFSETHEY
jgi:hypothetical protein